MVAYVIAEIDVTDPERYGEYKAKAGPAIEGYGGRFLARGGPLEAFEGKPAGPRVVIIEFPSLDQARRWYHSREYSEAKGIRRAAARATVFAVEGL